MIDSVMPAETATSGRYAPGQLGVLTAYVPPEAVDEALARTGCVQRRLRLLPTRVVVYFVLALTLFPRRGYGRVWDVLVQGMATPVLVTTGALRQARQRLGAAPLAALWDWVCGPLAWPGSHGAFYRRWRLLAWDATTLDVPDTDDVATVYPTAGGSAGRSGYRKLTVVGLVECGTRAFVAAVFGVASEIGLARQLLDKLRPGQLLLADRNYYSWRLWHAAAASGADLLWRVRNHANLPVTDPLPDGSYLSRFPERKHYRDQPDPLPVRVIEATITITDAVGATRTELYRLITTISDHRAAPAAELADLYTRRWEIETAFYCWKTLQQGRDAVLRSKTARGVEQEAYAYLITCQCLRIFAHDAAEHARLDVEHIAFTVALDTVTDSVADHHAHIRLRTLAIERLTQALNRVANRPRHIQQRPRQCPRTRKRPVSKFPSKRPGRPASQHVSYNIKIKTAHQP